VAEAVKADDGAAALMAGLSPLELAMLVAMQRVDERGRDVFNFEMAFDEYRSIRQDGQGHMWRRRPCLRAFEALAGLGLVRLLDARVLESRTPALAFAGATLCVTRAEVEAGAARNATCPDLLRRWLSNETSILTLGALQ